MNKHCVTYHIDKEQRIVFLNDNWNLFANSNSGGHLTSNTVLNKTIFTFISDESCRHLYQMLIQRCRKKQKVIKLSFRCDSPETRRFMLMEIIPLENESIEFKSCIVKEVSRDPVKLLYMNVDRSDEFVKICSWCKRVRVNENNWVEVEDAIEKMGLFSVQVLPQLTHGMCQKCYEYVRKKFSR